MFATPRVYLSMLALGLTWLAKAQVFVNHAPGWGITQQNWDGVYGAAVSTADWNNDGWPDVTFGNTQGALRTFRNLQGNGFMVLALPWVMESETKALLWIDLDNDGDDDLFIQEASGRSGLLRNDGFGNFTDVTESSGLPQDVTEAAGASFGDMDNDGDLDLYLCRYWEFSPDGSPPEGHPQYRNVLLRNDGNLAFTDVSVGSGACDDVWLSFQSLWWDQNEDGLSDIYVINDKSGANALFRNQGDGTFENVAHELGLDLVMDCMSASLGDFNQDGLQDIFNTNTHFGGDGLGAKLLVGQPGGHFDEQSALHGLNMDRFCWGAAWMDADNDTDLDLFVAEHDFLAPYGVNHFYRNFLAEETGDDPVPFSPFEEDVYPIDYLNSHVVATADFDHNGWVDFVMHNLGNHAARIWMNQGFENGNQSISLGVQGTLSNPAGAGSLLSVEAGGVTQTRVIHVGENYLSQESEYELFGLGDGEVNSVSVRWPSGLVESFDVEAHDLTASSQHVLVEGTSACPQSDVALTFCSNSGGDLPMLSLPTGALATWEDEWGYSFGNAQSVPWTPEHGSVTATVFWMGQMLCDVTFHPEVSPVTGDHNASGFVGMDDVLLTLGDFGCAAECLADMTGDEAVTIGDLLLLLTQVGEGCD